MKRRIHVLAALTLALFLTAGCGAEETILPAEPESQETVIASRSRVFEQTDISGAGHVHEYEVEVVEPTCQSGGYTKHTCACGVSFVDAVTEPVEHKYETETVSATCTEGGYTRHTCVYCGDTYVDGETEPSAHRYMTTLVKATCTTDGYVLHACSMCGDSYKLVAKTP